MLSPFFYAFNNGSFSLRKRHCVHSKKEKLAEREGFEPSVELSPHTRLAGERLQPARPSLQITQVTPSAAIKL